MKDKIDIQVFADFKEEMVKKIDDLENRSKRNNLVFWNIPEGEEKDIGCVNLIQPIPVTHMKITAAEDMLIDRTHRSGRPKSNYNSATSPRPIHVKFLNWSAKDFLIKRAPKSLKNNPYGPQKLKVIMTDDVSKRVREHRQTLKSRHLPEILTRPNVKVAFIPYLVPARIQYKVHNSWKFFFLPDDQQINTILLALRKSQLPCFSGERYLRYFRNQIHCIVH